MTSFRPRTQGRKTAAAVLIAALAVALPSWQAAADHDGQTAYAGGYSGGYGGVTPLQAMPPLMALAYAVGIQEELLAHGYDAGQPDGTVGGRTVRAIRAYQRDAGLPADGMASKELLDHLKFALPKVYAGRTWQTPLPVPQAQPEFYPQDQPESYPQDRPEFYPQPQERPGAPTNLLPPRSEGPSGGYLPDDVTDGVTSEPLPELSRKQPATPVPDAGRQSGGIVSQIQLELARLGYYDGPVDGAYGSDTRGAVYSYQQDIGLPATGEIDQALLDALLPPERMDGSVPL